MRNLFQPNPEEERQEELRLQRLQQRETEILSQMELFKHPGWAYFRTRLGEMESAAMEELVNCEPQRVHAIRERIRVVRDLAATEGRLRSELANLRVDETSEEDYE